MWLYQCLSRLPLKVLTDGDNITFSSNELQLLFTLLLEQCCRILVSPISDSDLWFLLTGHVSATHHCRHTHCVDMYMFLSCRLSLDQTLMMTALAFVIAQDMEVKLAIVVCYALPILPLIWLY